MPIFHRVNSTKKTAFSVAEKTANHIPLKQVKHPELIHGR